MFCWCQRQYFDLGGAVLDPTSAPAKTQKKGGGISTLGIALAAKLEVILYLEEQLERGNKALANEI